MSQYMLLVYEEEVDPAAQRERERELPMLVELHRSLREAGLLVGVKALRTAESATSVRVRGGEAEITDGPFAVTKEVLAGYYVLECADLDEALKQAARLPMARWGTVEVRPVVPPDEWLRVARAVGADVPDVQNARPAATSHRGRPSADQHASTRRHDMPDPEVTTRERWLVARRELLAQERELTRHRDEVNAARRRLPMVEITKDYSFDGPHGKAGLIDLFEGRSQLLIYHLMFEPDADEACPSCSFWIDNLGHLSHMHARDTSFAAVSRAPLDKLERYKQRMGWTIPLYSSSGSDFNYDFHVTLDPSIAPVEYNYKDAAQLERENPAWQGWSGEEMGVSAFLRARDRIFHTYSCYERGIDLLNGTYNWLDLTARGRQENWEQPPGRRDDPAQSWVRRHDEYEPADIGGASTPE